MRHGPPPHHCETRRHCIRRKKQGADHVCESQCPRARRPRGAARVWPRGRASKDGRHAARQGARSGIAAGMASRGIRLANPPGHTRNDVVGLVGEMLCAELLPCLGLGEPFHVKWKESGSSLTNGIDLVFKKGNRLCATESKHLHRSIGGGATSASAARAVSSAMNKSLAANTDYHTTAYIGTLVEKERRRGNECDAVGDKKGRESSDRRCSFLCSVIESKNYSMGVAAVFDGPHNPEAADIDAGLSGASQDQFANPVLALPSGSTICTTRRTT